MLNKDGNKVYRSETTKYKIEITEYEIQYMTYRGQQTYYSRADKIDQCQNPMSKVITLG